MTKKLIKTASREWSAYFCILRWFHLALWHVYDMNCFRQYCSLHWLVGHTKTASLSWHGSVLILSIPSILREKNLIFIG